MASEIGSLYPALNSITNTIVGVPLFTLQSLPGYGKKTKDICNTVTSADYCPSCHRTLGHYYHCKNFMCPECFRSAARQAATRAADYLLGCHEAWRAFGKHLGYINHIELSIPAGEYHDFNKTKKYSRAIKYAKQIGISGGGVVFHAFRIKK
ncbi:MAG TPA: hypothetical protein VHT73_19635, partial [Thermodesulfobacteriota bacterium]|nr:hypothetical protein [Thermodesulfobacteriota bacterium]